MKSEKPSQTTTKAHIALLFATPHPTDEEAHLASKLTAAGFQVTPLSLATQQDGEAETMSPLWSDIRTGVAQLAQSLSGSLTGQKVPPDWLLESLARQAQNVDAAVTLDPKVAQLVFPSTNTLWPNAIRIGLEAKYHIAAEWASVAMDDMIVPHPALGERIQFTHQAPPRLSVAGPLVGGGDIEPRILEGNAHTVVVSFHGLDEGDIDPLLFQLSMAIEDEPALLFLRTGAQHIDELVKVKASQYGLRGKRPRSAADSEAWIAGATALVGLPSPTELTQAIHWKVPTVLFTKGENISPGHQFVAQHGAAIESTLAVTLSVDIESVLPGGRHREALGEAMENLVGTGSAGIVVAIETALTKGRRAESVDKPPAGMSELEDIGLSDPIATIPQVIGPDMRRMYLSEVILRQNQVQTQLNKTREGVELWKRRIQLAQDAGREELTFQAKQRLEGLQRIAVKLENQVAGILGLRDRLASNEALTSADRQSATQLLGPNFGQALTKHDGDSTMFSQLEIDDALQRLKNKLDDLS